MLWQPGITSGEIGSKVVSFCWRSAFSLCFVLPSECSTLPATRKSLLQGLKGRKCCTGSRQGRRISQSDPDHILKTNKEWLSHAVTIFNLDAGVKKSCTAASFLLLIALPLLLHFYTDCRVCLCTGVWVCVLNPPMAAGKLSDLEGNHRWAELHLHQLVKICLMDFQSRHFFNEVWSSCEFYGTFFCHISAVLWFKNKDNWTTDSDFLFLLLEKIA